ncbi:MAG: DNA-binding MarR family transcriptional regulator [Gammaproteobacteria bacterium]|jgi:DNA-binding MarR family transcriptional regulator
MSTESTAIKTDTHADVSKTHLRLWLKMLKTTKLIEAELRERLRVEYNTTLPRFDVMAALYRDQDGLKMSELSGVLKVSNGNVTGIVDRLVEEGLVKRIAVKGDRRAMLVKLTPVGGAAFLNMAKIHEKWVDNMLITIDLNESEQLNDLLTRIDNDIEQQRMPK